MNKQQALDLLGLGEDDSPDFVRKRYRTLMKQYHPDVSNTGKQKIEMAQQLTEAYRFLKTECFLSIEKDVIDWGLRENMHAYTKRMIYMEDDLFGHEITAETGLRGRFYWDPEIESFLALLKSVSMETARILEGNFEGVRDHLRAKLLHLLLQEFIDPYESLVTFSTVGRVRCSGSEYIIPCQFKPEPGREKATVWNRELLVRAEGSRLMAFDGGNRCGTVHFHENEFYYIITPLILQKAAEAKLVLEDVHRYWTGRMKVVVDESRRMDVTEKINMEIRHLLQISG